RSFMRIPKISALLDLWRLLIPMLGGIRNSVHSLCSRAIASRGMVTKNTMIENQAPAGHLGRGEKETSLPAVAKWRLGDKGKVDI
ncbi:MAG: hypothetical protein K0B15_13805, partial [Lentimicrobium sp.]|nr:hypothetical protein [Lentimicrobium sp.]